MQATPLVSGGVPAPAPLLPVAIAPAPAPNGAGQTLVATLDLAGAGLSPLSSQDAAALLATVNKTLAARGETVSSIRLGNVTVSGARCNTLSMV